MSAGVGASSARKTGHKGDHRPGKTGHRGDHRLLCGFFANSGPPKRSKSSPSSCEPYREQVELGLRRGRNAMAIWQDLVSDHGFAGGYEAAGGNSHGGSRKTPPKNAFRRLSVLVCRPTSTKLLLGLRHTGARHAFIRCRCSTAARGPLASIPPEAGVLLGPQVTTAQSM